MARASQEAVKIAKKFISREHGKSPLTNISTGDWRYPEKGRRITTDGETIYSYDWWPIANWGSELSLTHIWITEDRYQTGEWKSGKPKYSPTTDGHIQAVEDAARIAGFDPTGTVVNTENNRTFRLWRRAR